MKVKFLIPSSLIVAVVFLLSGPNAPAERTIGLIRNDPGTYPGYTLFAPLMSTTTYLINNSGVAVHSWESVYQPGNAVYLLENGDLLRTTSVGNSNFQAGGSGGGVQEIEWGGTVTWEYMYSSSQYCQHHDIEMLPSGNLLMIAWEKKSYAECIAAGRDPSLLDDNELWPDSIIEVEPTGPTTGDIVWEWHVWDHLVQDYDPSKDNYGIVEDHPELIDLNYVDNPSRAIADWNHTNSVAYSEELDQILLSIHNFDEIWIIDHSTTTSEAAGHTGGNSGRGGDLLYRWGNPRTYGAGGIDDQKFFGQHDAVWIEDGFPGEENILLYNNGMGRPEGPYSSVEEITPPLNEGGTYDLIPGSAYGPDEQAWIYTDQVPTDFYSSNISGSQRLANGNTLICEGSSGALFEIDDGGDTIWEFINPVNRFGPQNQGTEITNNPVFKCRRYDPDYAGLTGRDLTVQSTIEIYDFPYSRNTDFNGDGTADIAIFRESSGLWAIRDLSRIYFGALDDQPVPRDYNGDGTSEIGIFRSSSGLWAIKEITRAYFGSSGDQPVPADYSGDGSCQMGIFRESNGLWSVRNNTRTYFGQSGDEPVPADFDGNHIYEVGLFRPDTGLWAIRNLSRMYFGSSEDEAVQADYDGDGICDVGIFRPTTGLWAIRDLTRSYFGGSTDDPIPSDYNGDGAEDIGIFRASSGLWAISGFTRVYFGTVGDIPVTR